MTDTPENETAEAPAAATPEPGTCRWCGAYHEGVPGEDFLCAECDHYQNSMICPTCGELANVAALPADVVPAPVAPKKAKGK